MGVNTLVKTALVFILAEEKFGLYIILINLDIQSVDFKLCP